MFRRDPLDPFLGPLPWTPSNLARTLGFGGSPAELIARLDGGRRQSFDVGSAKGPWGERRFFEGAGAGLLPDYLREWASLAKGENESLSPKQEIARHVSLLRRLLPAYAPREWQISVDGDDISGRYILVEAMNIRSVGPVLTLAPQARTEDGKFDLVAMREGDRARLAKYLESRLAEKPDEFPIPARTFRQLRITWEESTLHFDDKLWPEKDEQPPGPSEIEITVEASALEVLLPGEAPGELGVIG